MGKKMPKQKPGESKQDYGTPPEFIQAVEARFGMLTFDLAATSRNTVVPDTPSGICRYFSRRKNSLAQDWRMIHGLLWLNPEFERIGRWAEKCAASASSRTRIMLLTPASVGSEWFANHVHPNAITLGLRPRLIFVGERQPYPKDLMLSLFGFGARGFDTWRWDA